MSEGSGTDAGCDTSREHVGTSALRERTQSEGTRFEEDRASGERAARLDDLLGRPRRDYAPGDPLLPLTHWLHFAPRTRLDARGPDGHPARDDQFTDLPRRMWAAGEIVFRAPLCAGVSLSRRSEVASVERKTGRSGTLGFVQIDHRVEDAAGGRLVEERQTLVYRPAGPAGPRPVAPGPDLTGPPAGERTLTPDPVLLFLYSALTQNGHRIHYDQAYATGVEGYPGLVVHGPLVATLLLDLAREIAPRAPVGRFAFRALGPLFADRPATLRAWPVRGGVHAWAFDADGVPAMRAETRFAPDEGVTP